MSFVRIEGVSHPITKFGEDVESPFILRLSAHRNFIASVASMIASDDPMVAVPHASGPTLGL